MLNKNSVSRPDSQLEKMLVGLVYAVVGMTLSLLMLFIYPQYSLYIIVLTLFLTMLCIGLAISVLSASEKALTYGGFANELLNSRDIAKRIDNNRGEAVIENMPAKKFFGTMPVLEKFRESLWDERSNLLNFQRLEFALKSLKSESVCLMLISEGAEEWYEVSIRPLYLKKSDIFEEDFSIEKIQKETYFLWTAENITASKNMEKIFEEERKKLHNFINNMPVGIYVADANFKIEYVNDTFASQLSQDKNSIAGKNLAEFLIQDCELLNTQSTSFAGMAVFRNALEENSEVFVVQDTFKDGTDVKIRGVVLKDVPNDEQLCANLSYAADEIDWLFNGTPNGVLFVDENGSICSANAKAAEILGVPTNMLQEKSVADFLTAPTLKMLKEFYKEYLADSRKRDFNKIEARLKSDKIVRIYVTPRWRMHNEKSSLDGLALYLSDTTEQRNLELRFAQAQKMQAMGQLAGGVAHDFNNLLTAMIGFCDLLLQRHGVGDPSFADLIQIKQNANRAAGLVRQLLAFSRKQPLKPKRIDVTENFIELSHLLKRILGEQISLEFRHGSDLGFIRVDPVQFSQVIINLAVNAKDAMNGKGRLTISTCSETLSEPYQFGADVISPGDFVVISVTDTGCGIPLENMGRIFEPFFSTKQNVVGSGTGLGLAMVYGIVRQTEGFIKVESMVGKGTTFSIHLPRFEKGDEPETGSQVSETGHTPVLTSNSSGQAPKLILGLNVSALDHSREQPRNPQEIKILFVEDEDSVRAFGVRALKKKGFSVTACNSAESALELLDRGDTFNLLITDMVMPGLSGADLAKEIRIRQPEIHVILASGYSEEIARRELAGSEEFDFIAKPYSLGDLTKKVFDVLNNRQN